MALLRRLHTAYMCWIAMTGGRGQECYTKWNGMDHAMQIIAEWGGYTRSVNEAAEKLYTYSI